jgi:uncharacterized protein DUF6494
MTETKVCRRIGLGAKRATHLAFAGSQAMKQVGVTSQQEIERVVRDNPPSKNVPLSSAALSDMKRRWSLRFWALKAAPSVTG